MLVKDNSRLESSPYSFKRKLDENVDQGYLHREKHPKEDLYIYSQTDLASAHRVWTPEILAANGLVTDKHGNVISFPFRKIFSLEEYVFLFNGVNASAYDIYPKIDGRLMTVFSYNGPMIVSSKKSFDDIYVQEVHEYYGSKLRTMLHSHFLIKTFIFEAVLHNDLIIRCDDPGLYLIGVLNSRLLDVDTHNTSIFYDGPIVRPVQTSRIPDILEQARKVSNHEGWIIKYKNQQNTRIKIQTNWFKEICYSTYCKDKFKTVLSSSSPDSIYDESTLLPKFTTRYHEKLRDRIEEIRGYLDEDVAEIGNMFIELYSPNREEFMKILDSVDYLGEYKKYMLLAYNKKDWITEYYKEAINKYV